MTKSIKRELTSYEKKMRALAKQQARELAKERAQAQKGADKFFVEALEALGIPLTLAGLYLGLSPRQPIRYGRGNTPVPGPVRKLLKLAIAKKLTADDLRAL